MVAAVWATSGWSSVVFVLIVWAVVADVHALRGDGCLVAMSYNHIHIEGV